MEILLEKKNRKWWYELEQERITDMETEGKFMIDNKRRRLQPTSR
jgi:hypothetical protein